MRSLRQLLPVILTFAAIFSPDRANAQAAPVTRWGGPPQGDGTERRSPALMITGYSLAGTGTAAIMVGATMMSMSERTHTVCAMGDSCDASGQDPLQKLGAITLAAGGGVTAIGLALGIWGTLRVHGTEEPRRASATPTVVAGPGKLEARWRF
jgi:hypothetical protein